MVESKALSEPIQMQTNYIHKCLPLKHRLPDHDHLFTSLLFLFSLSSAKAVTTKKHQYCVKSRWRKFVFFFYLHFLIEEMAADISLAQISNETPLGQSKY